jgi:hypothetical protein
MTPPLCYFDTADQLPAKEIGAAGAHLCRVDDIAVVGLPPQSEHVLTAFRWAHDNQRAFTMFLITSPSGFNAKADLRHVMANPDIPSADTLAEARKALARLQSQAPISDEDWAASLSDTFSSYSD